MKFINYVSGSSEESGGLETAIQKESQEESVLESRMEAGVPSLPLDLELRGGGVWTRSPLASRARLGSCIGKWSNKPIDPRFALEVSKLKKYLILNIILITFLLFFIKLFCLTGIDLTRIKYFLKRIRRSLRNFLYPFLNIYH